MLVDHIQLVAQVTATLNNRYEVKGRLEIEQLHLQPLPIERFADYDPLVARVTSNQPFSEWENVFSTSAMTVAAVDWLVDHSTIIQINDESYRRKRARRLAP